MYTCTAITNEYNTMSIQSKSQEPARQTIRITDEVLEAIISEVPAIDYSDTCSYCSREEELIAEEYNVYCTSYANVVEEGYGYGAADPNGTDREVHYGVEDVLVQDKHGNEITLSSNQRKAIEDQLIYNISD